MTNQDMTSKHLKDLHFKEDPLLPGVKVSFVVIVFLATILDIRLYNLELMKEIFK
jgi:hypothetical protein